MFQEFYTKTAGAARGKMNFLQNNPLGYFISSMVAGMFIAFGGFVSMTAGSVLKLESAGAAKIIPGFLFAAALSFVIMAGSELFTGNNMVMAAGSFTKTVKWLDTIKLWIVCYIGNFAGSWLAVLLYHLTGLDANPDVAAHFASSSLTKVTLTPVQMLSRGILCNMLVCIAVWCSIKMASESGKLIMTVWCIITFMICGFEHSVANMSIVGVGLLTGSAADTVITVGQYFYNLFFVTIGNMLGGILFVALPYFLMAREKK